MRATAIVLGAGSGARLGEGVPKALVDVGGRSLLAWSAAALGRARSVEAVLCVVPPGGPGEAAVAALEARWSAPARLLPAVTGAPTRQSSLARGLQALAADAGEWVLVHDAARPLVAAEDAEAVLAAARPTGAALPLLPVTDTVKRVEGDHVTGTLERDGLALAQTPQAFALAVLREALEKAARDGFEGTDCASLVERLGVPVRHCPGRADNFKVTHPHDLERARALLLARVGRA